MKLQIVLLAFVSITLTEELFSNFEQLTDDNWDQIIEPDDYMMWLVTFYVPWCTHA